MIPSEKQVTSLEPSKRLAELGEPQDSLWYWCEYNEGNAKPCLKLDRLAFKFMRQGGQRRLYSAFSVAEHGIALPRTIHSYRDTNFVEEFWVCEQRFKNREFADTEANARAKMRIYLIEKKIAEAD